MPEYAEWIRGLSGKQIFVAYPTGFDFTFVYWYLVRFAGGSPLSFWAVYITSYAMAMLHCGYRESSKRNMPKQWFDPVKHTHVALDDAIEQGRLLCNTLRENGVSTKAAAHET